MMKFKINEEALKLLIFVSSLVGFFVISFLSNFAYDDFNYKFIYSETSISHTRVKSLLDIIVSQYHHYFVHSGRVLIHSIVQFFLMFDSKIWFDISNAVVFALFQLIISKIAFKKSLFDLSLTLYLFLILALWFVLPGLNYCMFWLSGSVNYLWSTTAGLFLLYIHSRTIQLDNSTRFQLGILFIYGLFLNATHEVLSIAISVALFSYLLINYQKLNRGVVALSLGAFVSTLITASSPANFKFALVSTAINHPQLKEVVASNENHLMILIIAISGFFVLFGLFLLLYIFRRAQFLYTIRENYVMLIVICVSVIFAYLVNAFNQRAIFSAATISIVIALKMIAEFEFVIRHKLMKFFLGVAFLLLVFEFVKVIPELEANKESYKHLETEILNSDKSVTLYGLPQLRKNRFMCYTGLGNNNRFWISNEGMSRLFGREYLVFLPNKVVDKVKSYENKKSSNQIIWFPKNRLLFVNIDKFVAKKIIDSKLELNCVSNDDNANKSFVYPNFCATGGKYYLFLTIPKDFSLNLSRKSQLIVGSVVLRLNIYTN